MSQTTRYSVGEFAVDLAERELSHAGERIRVQPKTFELLAYFVQHPNTLQSKDTLLDEVWNGAFVTETSLAKRDAICTNFAAARACKPSLLLIIMIELGTGYGSGPVNCASRWLTAAFFPAASNRFAIFSAIYTDRWRPPVQPKATVR